MKDFEDFDNPSLVELSGSGVFTRNRHKCELVSDALGWQLYCDGKLYKEYSIRANVAKDIIADITAICEDTYIFKRF